MLVSSNVSLSDNPNQGAMSMRPARYRSTRKARPTLHDLTPEASVQETLCQALHLHGWRWWHFPKQAYGGNKCRQCGAQAPPAGIPPGWPDLIGIKAGRHDTDDPPVRLVVIECKAEGEKPTVDQAEVLGYFYLLAGLAFWDDTPIIEAGVCMPSSLDAWLEMIARR